MTREHLDKEIRSQKELKKANPLISMSPQRQAAGICHWPLNARFLEVPDLQRVISGGRYKGLRIKELDVANGLLMASQIR